MDNGALPSLPTARIVVPEDLGRMTILPGQEVANNNGKILAALRDDQVVLVQDLSPEQANTLMMSVSAALGLADSLEVQAEFASILGHRENVGQYYMTVNKRKDYQFVCPHSEGGSFDNFQLASFYCYENSTDGGETILMNTRQPAGLWESLREQVRRGKARTALTPGEIRRIKMELRLDMPGDALQDDDEILSEDATDPALSIYEVLSKPVKSYSSILGRELHVYWTDIESLDLDSLHQFHQYLSENNLLRLPEGGMEVENMDDQQGSRIRRFGSRYEKLFTCQLTRKLRKGEFIIMNNLSWTHAASNWTPGSGVRRVVAAFA